MEEKIKGEERKFEEFFYENANGNNKDLAKCRALFTQYRLLPANDYLKREFYERDENGKNGLEKKQFGRIDLIFRYRGNLYCGEIKYSPFSNYDFWDGLKVVGYTVYYNWLRIENNKEFAHPAIFIPNKNIKLEHKIVASKLGVLLVGVEKQKSLGYKLTIY